MKEFTLALIIIGILAIGVVLILSPDAGQTLSDILNALSEFNKPI